MVYTAEAVTLDCDADSATPNLTISADAEDPDDADNTDTSPTLILMPLATVTPDVTDTMVCKSFRSYLFLPYSEAPYGTLSDRSMTIISPDAATDDAATILAAPPFAFTPSAVSDDVALTTPDASSTTPSV